jgi:hypothetical protein
MNQYPLRLPEQLMQQVRQTATEEGVSVNQYLGTVIAQALGHRNGVRMMEERAKRADFSAVDDILARVPDVTAQRGDERRIEP